jgi:hypothetical protein
MTEESVLTLNIQFTNVMIVIEVKFIEHIQSQILVDLFDFFSRTCQNVIG